MLIYIRIPIRWHFTVVFILVYSHGVMTQTKFKQTLKFSKCFLDFSSSAFFFHIVF